MQPKGTTTLKGKDIATNTALAVCPESEKNNQRTSIDSIGNTCRKHKSPLSLAAAGIGPEALGVVDVDRPRPGPELYSSLCSRHAEREEGRFCGKSAQETDVL